MAATLSSWVVVQVQKELFGINCGAVKELTAVPAVTRMPKQPPHMRGVFNLRGKVMPVFDLRTRLGLPSLKDEDQAFIAQLRQREKDHRAWMAELEASIREKRAFGLTTDPHQCAFGRWYDSFRSESLLLTGLLKKFDGPHREVHAVGARARALFEQGKADEALVQIETARRGALHRLLDSFAAVYELLAQEAREVAVVVDAAQPRALAVDSVVSVEALSHGPPSESDEVLGRWKSDLVTQIARRRNGGALVLLLDPYRIGGDGSAA